MYKDPFPGTPNNLETEPDNPIDILAPVTGAKRHTLLEVASSSSSARMNGGQENPSGKLQSNIESVVNVEISDPQMKGRGFEPPTELTNRWEVDNNAIDDTKETAIELSLKRLRGIMDTGDTIQDNHNPLRQSELSAFSRFVGN